MQSLRRRRRINVHNGPDDRTRRAGRALSVRKPNACHRIPVGAFDRAILILRQSATDRNRTESALSRRLPEHGIVPGLVNALPLEAHDATSQYRRDQAIRCRQRRQRTLVHLERVWPVDYRTHVLNRVRSLVRYHQELIR